MSRYEDPLTPDLFDPSPVPSDAAPPSPPAAGGLDDPGARDYLPLAEFAERCYLSYAMSVVLGRALPHVEDGLKPVQRRILHAMREMGLGASGRHVKSARVVGDVIGKLHPHGDQSVYDALVRMAQDFTLRYPLIDGQGNFGSRDGDGAAAMRYTESRLTPIAELLLAEIDQGTVDFRPNYDGAFREPVLLPARLPLLLANGASGIAVGMACEIPSHNLRELAEAVVLLLKDPTASLDDLMTCIPGPDFPGGGQVISPPGDLLSAYESGRGSLRVRARWEVELLARGQWRVVVKELPPGVSTAQVLTQIDILSNPQPRAGKKELSQEQKNLRTAVLAALEAARDESDEKAPVRIVLEPQSRNQDPETFMRLLLAQTSLETTLPMNLTVVGRDGRPAQKGLHALLSEWAAFRVDTVRRRASHRLEAVHRRLHILEGRRAVLLDIDAVIRVIRDAEDPKADLIATFALSEIQADDILEIRLRQLARLEAIKISHELADLAAEREGLQKMLGDGEELKRTVIREIRTDARLYGDARRTLIETASAVTATRAEDTLPDEPITVIVSRNGWLRARAGHGIDPDGFQYKAGDSRLAVIETRTTWPMVIMDSAGRCHSVRITDLPTGRGEGIPLSTLADMASGERPLHALSAEPDTLLLVSSNTGHGFLCKFSAMFSRQRAGKAFLSVEEQAQPLAPLPVTGDWIAAAADNGRLLVFPVSDMKALNGGKGVQIMKLAPGEHLIALASFDGLRLDIRGRSRSGKPVTTTLAGATLDQHRQQRAHKGVPLDKGIRVEGLAGGTA